MSETDCQSAIRKFGERDLRGWAGLPEDCSFEQITAVFPLANEGVGISRLGETKKQFHLTLVNGYAHPVRAWIDGSRVLLLDTRLPVLATGLDELEKSLGEPDIKLDYDWGTLKLDGGEWVYASRGLALFVVPSNRNLAHLAVFPATSTEEYLAKYRVHLGKRLKPLSKGRA